MAQGTAIVMNWNGGDNPNVSGSYAVVGNDTPGTGKTGQFSGVIIMDGMSIHQINEVIADAIQTDWLAGTGGIPLLGAYVVGLTHVNL